MTQNLVSIFFKSSLKLGFYTKPRLNFFMIPANIASIHEYLNFWCILSLKSEHMPLAYCNTGGEYSIATIKMRINFCYPLKMVILDFSLLLPI